MKSNIFDFSLLKKEKEPKDEVYKISLAISLNVIVNHSPWTMKDWNHDMVNMYA